MRHTLDESPHSGDLELIGMLPAHLRKLVLAWKALDFAASPGGRMVEFGIGHGKTGEYPMPDQARRELRAYAEARRKEIDRLADKIITKVREVKTCRTCKAENDVIAPNCESCGAPFRNVPALDTHHKPLTRHDG